MDDFDQDVIFQGSCLMMTGVPGVGKSYLIKELQKAGDLEGFQVLSMGSIMFEIAKDLEVVDDRDQMRYLDRETQLALQQEASQLIQSEYLDQGIDVLLDTHLQILTKRGYMGTLSVWTATAIDIDYIILVEADPETIKSRRETDKSRKRNINLEEIQSHQEINRMTAFSYTVLSNTIIQIVDNSQGLESQALDKIKIILNDLD